MSLDFAQGYAIARPLPMAGTPGQVEPPVPSPDEFSVGRFGEAGLLGEGDEVPQLTKSPRQSLSLAEMAKPSGSSG
jgi:hypothetical protein